MAHETLITAAGGNGTAIRILDAPWDRSQYERVGKDLGERFEAAGAEQAGFLVLDTHHFEMAGGEFCGNASRAAALLFSRHDESTDVEFTVSGFSGTVHATVDESGGTVHVRCVFPGMTVETREVTLATDQPATIVDLGGIVHVVIEAPFPSDPAVYEKAHRSITEEFNLGERDAVGVVWFERTDNGVTIQPVVWVKAIDTFFHESSCGSGTIAVGKVTGSSSIIQPTGQPILAEITDDSVVLESEMEVVPVGQAQMREGS